MNIPTILVNNNKCTNIFVKKDKYIVVHLLKSVAKKILFL